MNTAEAFSGSMALSNFVILLATFLIVEVQQPQPAIRVFRVGVACNLVSWGVYAVSDHIAIVMLSLYTTAAYMWSLALFAALRAGRTKARHLIVLLVCNCLLYTACELWGTPELVLHTTAIFGCITSYFILRSLLHYKIPRTVSDLCLAVTFVCFVMFLLARSILVGLRPDIFAESEIVQFVLWPSLYTAIGIFVTTGYLEEAQQRSQALALRDPMTGLLNRRGFAEHLRQAVAQAVRDELPVTVIAIDLDRFKLINDKYGHEAGDLVLRRAAEVLDAELREVDLAARFGGEEFVAILPQASSEVGRAIAERLREAMASLAVDVPAGRIHFTASFGVVTDGAEVPFERLYTRADQALYRAKSAGRNRVEVADSRPDSEG